MTTNIEATDLGVSYGEVKVWSGINLKFSEPGLISILGPNGVGKSTLMYCINKILVPTEGNVKIDGEDVSELSFKDIALKVAYVPQASNETFAMTVMDTVLMGRYPHSGFNVSKEDLMVASKCLKVMQISHLAMRNFNELSAGQHQKVMIARGLAQEPDLLMLDEPTSNLDIYHQMQVMRMLSKVAKERGIIVLTICHDLNIASKYSDRVVIFSKGKVYCDGTPQEVITAENISKVYKVKADVTMVENRPYVLFYDGDIEDDE